MQERTGQGWFRGSRGAYAVGRLPWRVRSGVRCKMIVAHPGPKFATGEKGRSGVERLQVRACALQVHAYGCSLPRAWEDSFFKSRSDVVRGRLFCH
jgi:hypothetical protein